jgi:aminomethyltransferase
MKKTALTHIHEQLGAKMVSFANYSMPIQYKGVNIEHETVRNAVGVFDVSHMGEFLCYGPNALNLIQNITSNDASKLTVGAAQYSCMPNHEGGIVDDLIVYRTDAFEYMLVVNASNIEKDWNWIQSNNTQDVNLKNISDSISLLAVQGPKATNVIQKLTDIDVSKIKFYTFQTGTLAGIQNVVISATGYTGSGGFELYCSNKDVEVLWKALFEAGNEFGIQPIGLAARDTLRLEMGYSLYGNDIDDKTSPIEAGLGWITKFTKSFINADSLKNQKANGVQKKLVGFRMKERAIPRKGYEIMDNNGLKIGVVTSGTMSPSLGIGIGMGYVAINYYSPKSEIYIQIRKKRVAAEVASFPFYKP